VGSLRGGPPVYAKLQGEANLIPGREFKAGLTRTFKIMKLHPEEQEVQAVDREYTISWSAGLPTVRLFVSAFRGEGQCIEFGKAYALTETLAPGQVCNYHFDTREIKKPLQEAVTSCGWTYKGVAFGKF
jgi:hypothetical protein